MRKHAICPKCRALERHRIQFLTLQKVFEQREPAEMCLLHFAPEQCFVGLFRAMFRRYETADLAMDGVDHAVDIQDLPFADGSYDMVFASHVLEHVSDDHRAIAEIRRVLRPGGIAVLSVPLVGETTVEYGAPDPRELGHVRAPGYDYFDRMSPHFSRVTQYASESFPRLYQVFVYEDRSGWPNEMFPKRLPSPGERHRDVVAVCFA